MGYLIVWLFWLVGLALRIAGHTPPADPAQELAQSGVGVLVLSVAVSFAAENGAFSWIFDRRAVQLYGMLPVRREAVFLAVALAGVIPLLVAVGISGFVFAAILGFGQDAAAILPWMARHALLIVAFGGISALCLQLAGWPAFALLCYLLANLYAFAAQQIAESLYAMVAPMVVNASIGGIDWASPLVHLLRVAISWSSTCPFPDPGLDAALTQAVTVYALVGLACVALAMLLFARRNLERAGDPFVSPVVRNVVNVLASAIVGFAIAGLVLARTSPVRYGASPQLACSLPVVFSVLVYAATEAIMGHGLAVLRKRFPALVVMAGVALVASIACVAPAAGAAAFIPKPADVKSAAISDISVPFEDEEGIGRVCQLHSELADIAAAGGEPMGSSVYTVTLTYQMKDGRMVHAVESPLQDPITEEVLRGQVDKVLRSAGSSYVVVSYQECAPGFQGDAPWRSEVVSSGDCVALREALDEDIAENGVICAMPAYQLTGSLYYSGYTYQGQASSGSLLGVAVDTPYRASIGLYPTATLDENSSDTTIYLSEGATSHTVAWLRSRYGLEFAEW
ncbi:hypothetical protein IV77_GL001610 [Olsenella uli DSM 7084]|uniref:hypothetical protein n=1 Tax=Olsenella uli TaxID=133926 RepID=UPI0005A2D7D8|nr:hypothetical protein [Olsenella uli]KRO12474.1 hypothetical protein IV77_GL001610 [Olsenella uli DSM 7084]